MGKYLGCVEIIVMQNGRFYNFKPIAEIKDNFEIIDISMQDAEALLPELELAQINLGFNPSKADDLETMRTMFDDNPVVVFEFGKSDLSLNYDKFAYMMRGQSKLRPVGYKVDAIAMIHSGKIRSINTEGLYYSISGKDVLSDFINDNTVEVNISNLTLGEQALVEYNDMWAGPYEVDYNEDMGSYYIKPDIVGNKYTVSGYNDENVKPIKIHSYNSRNGAQEYEWKLLLINDPKAVRIEDVITEDIIIDEFKSCLQNNIAGDELITPDNFANLLEQNKKSCFTGSPLTQEIRQARLRRVQDFFTSNSDIENAFKKISEFILPVIVKNKNNEHVDGLLHDLFKQHPDLLEHVKDVSAIQEHIANETQKLYKVKEKREKLEDEVQDLEKRNEEIPQIDEAKKVAILQMDEDYKQMQSQLEEARQELGVYKSIADLKAKETECKKGVDYLEEHKKRLELDTQHLERRFENLIDHSRNRMADVAFDGYITSKLLRAAVQWEEKDTARQNEMLLNKIRDLGVEDKSRDELIDYLCRTVQLVRPAYRRNTIVNIAICLTQGFLTVFSGEPGCGKTSICNIFSDVLGLNKVSEYIDGPDAPAAGINRYVPLSVERGWTSKRDFVGYYNPLSKTFDKSNRKVYDALYQLDAEKRNGISTLPFIILLDEANLSPMEYYWSDFMNICDDLGPQSTVNLGENYVFGIPETLHFVATINNDHTTETLSPRLIDRAAVILLPYQSNMAVTDRTISSEDIELITWPSLAKAFIPDNAECVFPDTIKKIYVEVIEKLRAQRIAVSPRVDRAIKRYWSVASKCFVKDEYKTDPDIVALDYAVAQRILPKIMGSGELFKTWLEDLRRICTKHGLNLSAKILKDILDHGNDQMMYYQFFF